MFDHFKFISTITDSLDSASSEIEEMLLDTMNQNYTTELDLMISNIYRDTLQIYLDKNHLINTHGNILKKKTLKDVLYLLSHQVIKSTANTDHFTVNSFIMANKLRDVYSNKNFFTGEVYIEDILSKSFFVGNISSQEGDSWWVQLIKKINKLDNDQLSEMILLLFKNYRILQTRIASSHFLTDHQVIYHWNLVKKLEFPFVVSKLKAEQLIQDYNKFSDISNVDPMNLHDAIWKKITGQKEEQIAFRKFRKCYIGAVKSTGYVQMLLYAITIYLMRNKEV